MSYIYAPPAADPSELIRMSDSTGAPIYLHRKQFEEGENRRLLLYAWNGTSHKLRAEQFGVMCARPIINRDDVRPEIQPEQYTGTDLVTRVLAAIERMEA